jgi:hypothetical protein
VKGSEARKPLSKYPSWKVNPSAIALPSLVKCLFPWPMVEAVLPQLTVCARQALGKTPIAKPMTTASAKLRADAVTANFGCNETKGGLMVATEVYLVYSVWKLFPNPAQAVDTMK